MNKDRGEKKKKNPSWLQWLAFLFILGSVTFSGYTLWEVHTLQSEVTRHENAIDTLNALFNPILEMFEATGEFDRKIIELDYLANVSVDLGVMTPAEADATLEAAAQTYQITLLGKLFSIDQIFAAHGLDEDLTALEALSPGISDMFYNGTSSLIEFYWINPGYELVNPYILWNFFSYFENSMGNTWTYTAVMDLDYNNSAIVLNSSFWFAGPFTVGFTVQKLPLYIRETHTQPMLAMQNKIQGYIFGNGINAVAVLVLSFVANFDDKLLLKIISLVIAVSLLGFSAVSVIFL